LADLPGSLLTRVVGGLGEVTGEIAGADGNYKKVIGERASWPSITIKMLPAIFFLKGIYFRAFILYSPKKKVCPRL